MDARLAAARPLTRADRCDRCSAAARIRATVAAGELLFCGHHVRAHLDRLLAAGAELHPPPERGLLDW
ncbi:hypothetical protein [Pseudonocardia sp.]|uniref:DUF7455 domain-containing protein n=1 Tax=Pseudonocardia sp. TaxID=60912 RepID=UPI00261456F8|nr:hypothetical protein [Pseudonocardia sp.]